jgi:hypothetical protein
VIKSLPATNTGITAESATKMAMLKTINELVAAVNVLQGKVADLEARP